MMKSMCWPKQSLSLLLALVLTFFPLSVHAQERIPENTIAVQGTGSVTARPDAMQVRVGVETQAATVEAARDENARRMAAVTDRLKGLGIPNLVLQTTGFSVTPIRESKPRMTPPDELERPERIIGYRVRNELNVKVEGAAPERLSTDASRILDTALAAGANDVSGISFYLSRNNKAQEEALRLAIRQARQQAEVVAQASGVRLTGVYAIEAFAPPIAMRQALPAAAEMAGAPTPIETGEFEVTSSVTMRFDFQD